MMAKERKRTIFKQKGKDVDFQIVYFQDKDDHGFRFIHYGVPICDVDAWEMGGLIPILLRCLGSSESITVKVD
jgi:hypothetical protein